MDSIVKQRLVGALILVALGIVFWPIIFVPESADVAVVNVPVPDAPAVEQSPLPGPDNLGVRQGAAVADPPAVADVAGPPLDGEAAGPAGALPPLPARDDALPLPPVEAAAEVIGEPALDEDGLPIAFTLQVATMADRARAERLRDELVAAGYKGYLKRLRRGDRTLYRVLVGPKFTRAELEPIKVVIDDRWRVESLIMRYLP